jgi:cytochrome c-type biogenesis protein CcmH/NrfG
MGVCSVKSVRTAAYWVLVFASGFIVGVIFSAWKLDTIGEGAKQPVPVQREDEGAELRKRIAGLEKMLAVKPDQTEAWVELGNAYFDIGQHQKAIEAYRKSLQGNPRNPDVITDMGISYRKLGQPEEAVKAFKNALEIDPAHMMALFNMGIVYRDDLKKPADALAAWETFLEKAGNAPHAVMVRPWVEQLRKQLSSGGSGTK